ncbi:purine-cytosine permease family protein [Gephyromycinifex aptenodytis]|uniref:purine-cytosine permease family protein n=1 Tax=Gephyromycinifex aptenodytis TaxID=2716227 RepID=UPI0014460991|nr:cytosine permease [Gephyromycinifex aptenodytis]
MTVSEPGAAPLPEQATGLRSLLQVEDRGIEPLPLSEQTSRPAELFWIWLAGNISILGLPLGAWVVAGVLNFWQALLAGTVGAVGSFAIVGLISIAGQRGGAPSLTLSRATFGSLGNFGPTIVAILSRWGWETVNAVTAVFAILSIGTVLTGTALTPRNAVWLTVSAVLVFLALTLIVSGIGHHLLALFQQWATYIFGALTIIVLGFIITRVDWSAVANAEAGPASAVLIGIGTVAAGTGLAWANSGADLGRYQSPAASPGKLVFASAAGAGIPLVIMVGAGSLIAISNPQFDTDNPLSSIPELLPPWMSVPFLIAAFAGLLLSNNISVYSSGLTLLTLGIKTRRIVAVAIELVVSLIGSMVFLYLFDNFYDAFIGFITLLAIPLTAWVGVFLVDMLKRTTYDSDSLLDLSPRSRYWYTGGIEWRAMCAWLIGIAAGFIFRFPGLADSWITVNGLPWLVTLLVSSALYFLAGGARCAAGKDD